MNSSGAVTGNEIASPANDDMEWIQSQLVKLCVDDDDDDCGLPNLQSRGQVLHATSLTWLQELSSAQMRSLEDQSHSTTRHSCQAASSGACAETQPSSATSPQAIGATSPVEQGSHTQGQQYVPRAVCKFAMRGYCCPLQNCQFLHPPEMITKGDYVRPKPPPGYVCFNCGDSTQDHHRADCPKPKRCHFTFNGSVCTRLHCAFMHPPGTRHLPPPTCLNTTSTSLRPGPGYVCHNCGDTSRSHFKHDCPLPTRRWPTNAPQPVARGNMLLLAHASPFPGNYQAV